MTFDLATLPAELPREFGFEISEYDLATKIETIEQYERLKAAWETIRSDLIRRGYEVIEYTEPARAIAWRVRCIYKGCEEPA